MIYIQEKKNIKNVKKDVGMACQKVCKQGRDEDEVKVMVNLQSSIPTSFHTSVQSCFCTFMLMSVTVRPKPKNISFKCDHNPRLT